MLPATNFGFPNLDSDAEQDFAHPDKYTSHSRRALSLDVRDTQSYIYHDEGTSSNPSASGSAASTGTHTPIHPYHGGGGAGTDAAFLAIPRLARVAKSRNRFTSYPESDGQRDGDDEDDIQSQDPFTISLTSDGVARGESQTLSDLPVDIPQIVITDTPTLPSERTQQVPVFSRIPTELVNEVLLHYLAPTRNAGSKPAWRVAAESSEGPHGFDTSLLRWSHVCGDWRQLAAAKPYLWSTLSFRKPRSIHIPLAELWLERAQNEPLSLTISQSSGQEGEQEEQHVQSLLELLSPHILRWNDIHFSLTGKSSALLNDLVVPSSSQEIFWQLHSACLTLPNWDQDAVTALWRKLYASPSLQIVDWTDWYKLRAMQDAPWGQLTHIIFGRSFNVASVLSVLPQCKALISLTMTLATHRMPGITAAANVVAGGVANAIAPTPSSDLNPSVPEEIVLPHLQKLTVTVLDPRVGEILETLTLPSLQQLELFQKRSERERLSSPTIIMDLLRRSKCRLQALTISDPQMEENVLLELFANPSVSPSLKELEVWVPFTNAVAKALQIQPHPDLAVAGQQPSASILSSIATTVPPTVSNSNSNSNPVSNSKQRTYRNLLPNLEQIYICRCRTSEGVIPSMVLSRMNTESPLKLFGVHFSAADNKGKGDAEVLKNVGRLGLDLF